MTKMTSNSEESANIELDYYLGTTNSAENTETQDFNEVFIESIIVSNEAGKIPEGGTVQPQNETFTPATENNSPAKKKKHDWDFLQKLAIIAEAKSSTSTYRKTAKKYGISKGLIQHWRKKEKKIRARADAHFNAVGEIFGGGTTLFFSFPK